MPAVFTKISIRPPRTRVASAARVRDAAAEPSRSATIRSPFPPAARISATTASPRSWLRPLTTTWAPSAAKAVARAAPMLLVEPVISAVFPSSRDPISFLRCLCFWCGPEMDRKVQEYSLWTSRSSPVHWGHVVGGHAHPKGRCDARPHRRGRRRSGARARRGRNKPQRHPGWYGHEQEPAVPLLPGRQERPRPRPSRVAKRARSGRANALPRHARYLGSMGRLAQRRRRLLQLSAIVGLPDRSDDQRAHRQRTHARRRGGRTYGPLARLLAGGPDPHARRPPTARRRGPRKARPRYLRLPPGRPTSRTVDAIGQAP